MCRASSPWPVRSSCPISHRPRVTPRVCALWNKPARYASRRSGWTNSPTASPHRTATTEVPVTRLIRRAPPVVPLAVRLLPSPVARCRSPSAPTPTAPSALCGIFSWKPTYGTVSRAGTVPFADSLDCVGVMSRSVADLQGALGVLAKPDGADLACRGNLQPTATAPVRIGVLGGWFAEGGDPAAFAAVAAAASALGGAACVVDLPLAGAARSAAMLVTASEGAAAHLLHLRTRGADFDPMTRERFLAGALLPSAAYGAALRLRTAWCRQVAYALRDVDVLLAPAVPFPAPRLDEGAVLVDGQPVQVAPNLGMWTQPISFAGLPVVTVPVRRPEEMPLGVQVIARPHEDRTALAVAAALESAGFVATEAVAARHAPAVSGRGV